MLVGMAIEVLLKGIRVALEMPTKKTHRLDRLCDDLGIAITDDDRVILKALSEHIICASRYTVPIEPQSLFDAQELFDSQRRKSGNLANYHIAERSISPDNCERIWSLIAEYFERAHSARPESVELLYGPHHGHEIHQTREAAEKESASSADEPSRASGSKHSALRQQ